MVDRRLPQQILVNVISLRPILLGITANGKSDGKSLFQHILWLKALELGGLLTTHSNIFGSKVFFRRGIGATCALFSLNGRLR